MNEWRKLWQKHKYAVLCLSLVVVYCLIRFALGIPCTIKYLTGVSCAGCGMSRALFSLVKLDFAAAFHYHPLSFLVPVVAPFLAWFYVKEKKKHFTILLGICAGLLFGVYLWRLLAQTTAEVVVFQPENGLIYRLARRVISLFS